MPINVVCRSGFNNAEQPIGMLSVTPQEIQTACSLFGSNYILRMGLHYQRYVVGGYLPLWPVVHGIYTAASPAPILTTKNRATAVTGNIGESILSIVARRMLGAGRLHDVLPLNVTPSAKCPDFRIRLRPTFPPPFQAVTGLNPAVAFHYWPAESKAAASSRTARTALNAALAQLGTYWYLRRAIEPDVIGFGLVCCFIYKGTVAQPQQYIRIHVFAPSNQHALQLRIDHFRETQDRDGFLKELATPGSLARTCLQHG